MKRWVIIVVPVAAFLGIAAAVILNRGSDDRKMIITELELPKEETPPRSEIKPPSGRVLAEAPALPPKAEEPGPDGLTSADRKKLAVLEEILATNNDND